MRLLRATLRDQPARRFWDEPDERELNYRRQALDDGRNSPTPVVVDIGSAEAEPCGNERPNVPVLSDKSAFRGFTKCFVFHIWTQNEQGELPSCVVDRSERRSMLRMDQLRDQQW